MAMKYMKRSSTSLITREMQSKATMRNHLTPVKVVIINKVKVKSLSRVRLFATPWTVSYHAPLSMGFSRQEYSSGLPCLLQGIFLTQGFNLCL